MKFQRVFVVMPIVCLFFVSCIAPTTPTPIAHPCFGARITTPEIAEVEALAGDAPVSNEVQVSWDPEGCEMTVQFYLNGNPIGDYKGVKSGTSLEIDAPSSSNIEIKIWVEGIDVSSDSGWVTVTE